MAKGNRPTTATEAKRRLAKFGYEGPARWASIDDFVEKNRSAKAVIMANQGTFIKAGTNPDIDDAFAAGDPKLAGVTINAEGNYEYDGVELTSSGAAEPTIDVSNASAEAIATLADLTYLSQNTGVDTNKMNAAYEALGIDSTDNMAFTQAHKILEEAGYSPGYNSTFYGNNTPQDTAASILYDRWQDAPTDGSFVINDHVANQAYLSNALASQGVDVSDTNASLHTLSDPQYQNIDAYRAATDARYSTMTGVNAGRSTANEFDMLEWGKKESDDDDLNETQSGFNTTVNLGGNSANVPSYNIGAGTYTGTNVPSYTPINIPYQPVVGGVGTTEIGVPTYETNFQNQRLNFNQRGQAQQSYMQPQTLAEQQTAGTGDYSVKIEQVLYVNRQGLQQYITHIDGRPTQPIPMGFYRYVPPTYQIHSENSMAKGGYIQGYQEGGYVTFSNVANRSTDGVGNFVPIMSDNSELASQANQGLAVQAGQAQEQKNKEAYEQQQTVVQEGSDVDVNQPSQINQVSLTPEQLQQEQANLSAQTFVNPAGAITAAPVAYTDPNAAGTVMPTTTGQALPVAPIVDENQIAQVDDVTQATMPTSDSTFVAPTVVTAQEDMTALMTGDGSGFQPVQSEGPTQEITGQTQDTTAVSELEAAQIDTPQTVQDAPTRTLQTDELVSGSAVDQTKVGEAFGTGEVQAASVQDELSTLMAQFEGGNTPIWASGGMRRANQVMAQRGLSASSMAGQAIIQAAMESALPIAQIDVGNKQQMAMMKAEQRAKFLQIEFDQDFQAKVINASKVSEIANMNFNAEQQIALENARMAQTVDLNNLSNKQAVVMAEAAQLSQLEMAGLNNLQQAQVQNAQNFLQIDMANLSNAQQTEMFRQQTLANTILSDTAAENAMAQFNATNEQQRDQFMMSMASQVSQFNATQTNAMKQFNANEANAMLKYNSEIQNQREMFNAQQYAVIAQANAKWRQDTQTLNTAAANQSNFEYARQVNALTNKAIDQIWQRERDIMGFTFTASESALDRTLKMLLGDKSLEAARIDADKTEGAAKANLFARAFFGEFGLFTGR